MELQRKLNELKEQKNLSQAYISRGTGISESKLSQWIKGKYKGDNKSINEAVESFIKQEYELLNLPDFNTNFIETSIARKVFTTCKNCHYRAELGIVFGDAGLGKTTAVEKYVAENPSVILVKVNPAFTQKNLIKEIHKKAGYEGTGDVYTMLNEIIQRLKNSGRLLIVDQAEYLSPLSLDLLRTIYDEARIGLVLVGMPKLYFTLKGKRNDFRQLFTRVGHKTKLENLQPEDAEMIIKSFIPKISNNWRHFHDLSFGNTRALCFLVKRSIDTAQLNNVDAAGLSKNEIKTIAEERLVIEE